MLSIGAGRPGTFQGMFAFQQRQASLRCCRIVRALFAFTCEPTRRCGPIGTEDHRKRPDHSTRHRVRQQLRTKLAELALAEVGNEPGADP